MKINDTATTNRLLIIIVIPLLFYILEVLSFIFIPLMFAVFLSLLFTPIMRWMKKNKFPHWASLSIVVLIMAGGIFASVKLIGLSGREIDQGKKEIFDKFDDKASELLAPFQTFLGIDKTVDEKTIRKLLKSDQVQEAIFGNFGITFNFIQATITKVLMTVFFLLLLLAGSLNMQVFLQEVLKRGKTQSVKTFMTVEKSISRFLKVKILISLGTGIGFGLICYFFDISFPLFWGIFAFIINFVQMVGSVIATIVVSVFAVIEVHAPGTLLAVVLLLTGVQVLFGSILEPILMGKSFSINIIMVLIALMFWGYLWGIAGLILAIPMTVLMKTIMSEYQSTARIARLMS